MKTEIEKLKNDVRDQFQLFNKKLDDLLAAEKATEYELGKWYICPSFGELLFFAKENIKHNSTGKYQNWSVDGFGFNYHGKWITGRFGLENCRLATPEEIKTALVKEAEKKFPVGSVIHPVNHDEKTITRSLKTIVRAETQYTYNEDNDTLCGTYGTGNVYSGGTWAEIITEPVITIGGYKAEYSGDTVKFGCKSFIKRNVEALDSAMSLTNAEAVAIAGQTITREQVQQILKGFNP